MNASGRLNTCKSWGSRSVAIQMLATGKRVRNTYATFPKLVNSLSKERLIHRNLMKWHHFINIAPAVLDGRAPD
jgi:hypothetical protein